MINYFYSLKCFLRDQQRRISISLLDPPKLNSIDFYGVEEGSQASLVMISYNFSLVFFFNRMRPNGYPKWFKCITNQRNLTNFKSNY